MREIYVRYYDKFYAKIVFRKGNLNIEVTYPSGISHSIPRDSVGMDLRCVSKAEYDAYIIMRS